MKLLVIRISAIFIGIAFILFGIYREEFFIVFNKAINICLECIGIG